MSYLDIEKNKLKDFIRFCDLYSKSSDDLYSKSFLIKYLSVNRYLLIYNGFQARVEMYIRSMNEHDVIVNDHIVDVSIISKVLGSSKDYLRLYEYNEGLYAGLYNGVVFVTEWMASSDLLLRNDYIGNENYKSYNEIGKGELFDLIYSCKDVIKTGVLFSERALFLDKEGAYVYNSSIMSGRFETGLNGLSIVMQLSDINSILTYFSTEESDTLYIYEYSESLKLSNGDDKNMYLMKKDISMSDEIKKYHDGIMINDFSYIKVDFGFINKIISFISQIPYRDGYVNFIRGDSFMKVSFYNESGKGISEFNVDILEGDLFKSLENSLRFSIGKIKNYLSAFKGEGELCVYKGSLIMKDGSKSIIVNGFIIN